MHVTSYLAVHKIVYDLLQLILTHGQYFKVPMQIGFLQQTITWHKIRQVGGHAHYYSRTGTLK